MTPSKYQTSDLLKYSQNLTSNASQSVIASKPNPKSAPSDTCHPIYWLCSMPKANRIKISKFHRKMDQAHMILKSILKIKFHSSTTLKKVMYGHWASFSTKFFTENNLMMENPSKK
jgi:hypothetical protein